MVSRGGAGAVDDELHTRIQRNTQILQEARYNLPVWRPRSGHTSAHLQWRGEMRCSQWIGHKRACSPRLVRCTVDAWHELAFVVLDDDDEGVLAGSHIPATRFVKTRRATGMTEADADDAIAALRTPLDSLDEEETSG